MNRIRHRFPARGFSLLEVLVAVVILSIGLLALAILQLSLMRSSNEAKAETVALSLAKDKLEDMRSFNAWPDYIALADGTVNQTAGGTDYTITTEIRRYSLDNATQKYVYQATDNATDAAMSAAGYVVGRDFKRAKVTVTWNDASGAWGATPSTQRAITLEDVIDGLVPADSAKVAKNTAANKPRNIQVIIKDPSKVGGVIPIAISDSSDTAATNPKPELGGKDGNSVLETRFDILTYAALSGNNALAQSKVETVMVACKCDTATKPTATGARGYRPSYWNGVRYVAPSLTTYVPPAGEAALGKFEAQSSHCDVCCRDHNDPSGVSGAKFDPWRTAGHIHYGYNGSGVLTKVDSTQTKYEESCRLIRTDGILRVAPDYNNEYFNLLEVANDGSTTEFLPTTTAIANYQDLVLDYLGQKVISPTDLSTTPATTVLNHQLSDTDVGKLETSYSMNSPASITLGRPDSLDDKWLHSRGLYVDYLEKEALAAIVAVKKTCAQSDCSDKKTEILSILPFTSINVTELASYKGTSSPTYLNIATNGFAASTAADTTSAPKASQTFSTGSVPSAGVTGQIATVTFNDSNTGLAFSNNTKIDEDETASADTQSFAIKAGSSTTTIGTVNVTLDNSYYTFGAAKPSVNMTTSCSPANKAPYTYSCGSVSLPASVITLGSSQSYNYENSPKQANTITCSGVSGNKSYTTSATTDIGLKVCYDYQVVSGSSSGGAILVTPTTSDYTNLGKKNESAKLTFSPAITTDGEKVNIVMGLQSATLATGYTCTYSVSKTGKVTYNISDTGTCP